MTVIIEVEILSKDLSKQENATQLQLSLLWKLEIRFTRTGERNTITVIIDAENLRKFTRTEERNTIPVIVDAEDYRKNSPDQETQQKLCLKECQDGIIIRNCSCLPIYSHYTYPLFKTDIRKMCDTEKFTECVDLISNRNISFEECDINCKKACSLFLYESTSSTISHDEKESQIHKPPVATYGPQQNANKFNGQGYRARIKEKDSKAAIFAYQPVYLLNNLVADIGGCLGLWLGFSLLSMPGMFQLVIRNGLTGCKKRSLSITNRVRSPLI